MPNCVKCGAEIAEGVKFCPKCGANLFPEEPANKEPAGEPAGPVDINKGKEYVNKFLDNQYMNYAGIAGLATGALCVTIGWIRYVNYFIWFFAIGGILLSVAGLLKAKKEKKAKGISIAGLIVSIVGLVLSMSTCICYLFVGSTLRRHGWYY